MFQAASVWQSVYAQTLFFVVKVGDSIKMCQCEQEGKGVTVGTVGTSQGHPGSCPFLSPISVLPSYRPWSWQAHPLSPW